MSCVSLIFPMLLIAGPPASAAPAESPEPRVETASAEPEREPEGTLGQLSDAQLAIIRQRYAERNSPKARQEAAERARLQHGRDLLAELERRRFRSIVWFAASLPLGATLGVWGWFIGRPIQFQPFVPIGAIVGASVATAAGLGLGIGMGVRNDRKARDAERELEMRFSFSPRRGGGVLGARMRF